MTMTTPPTGAQMEDTSATNATMKTRHSNLADALAELPGGAASSEVTISSGQIVITQAAHTVDTEGDAGTDDLDNIDTTSIPAGRVLILGPQDGSRDVVVKNSSGGSGQIVTADGADYTMGSTKDFIVLMLVGSSWVEIARSNHRTQQSLTVIGDVTVATDDFVIDTVSSGAPLVGIGTDSPAVSLDVVGDIQTSNTVTAGGSSGNGVVLGSDGRVEIIREGGGGGNDAAIDYKDARGDDYDIRTELLNGEDYAISSDTLAKILIISGTSGNAAIQHGALVVGSGSPNGSAVMQADSTTQGFLPPRMTTAQRDGISNPVEGLVVYNTTTSKLNVYNGSAWEAVTSA